ARRRDRPQRDGARGGADRRRHRVLRRPLLRADPAHEPQLHVTAIAIDDVSVVLGGRSVVDGVSETVASGEWVTLLGPNGAGKSTLLRAIAGLAGFEGSISLDGRVVSGLGRRELARGL